MTIEVDDEVDDRNNEGWKWAMEMGDGNGRWKLGSGDESGDENRRCKVVMKMGDAKW